MNSTERAYAEKLEQFVASGDILGWRFEPVHFRLAQNTFFIPDFEVVYHDRIEFHEVKGGLIRDDAKAKFKVAAELFKEFGWKMQQYKGKQWKTILG